MVDKSKTIIIGAQVLLPNQDCKDYFKKVARQTLLSNDNIHFMRTKCSLIRKTKLYSRGAILKKVSAKSR